MPRSLLCSLLALVFITECNHTQPRIRVAFDVRNLSRNNGRPAANAVQVFCDNVQVVDTTLGNVFSEPARSAESANWYWSTVAPGRHTLRVVVPSLNLVKDTTLLLDTLSFTGIYIHHSDLPDDTITYESQGEIKQIIIPGDKTKKIMITKVKFDIAPSQ